jgi:hypothetical protein
VAVVVEMEHHRVLVLELEVLELSYLNIPIELKFSTQVAA